MNPEMRSLIHREWTERRSSLAVCSGWMLCCVIYVVAYEGTHRLRDPVAGFYQASLLYTLFAAIFLAMKTSLGDQTLGTLGFSLSLPVSRQRLAWTRLAGGTITLVSPVIIGAIVMTPIVLCGFIEQAPVRTSTSAYVQMSDRPALSAADATGLLWAITAIAIASGAQLLLILSIFGVRRRSESHIGFFGAVLAFGWTMLSGLRGMFESVNGWLGALFPVSFIINYGFSSDDGSYTDLDLGQPLWAPLLVNVVVLMVLARWFVRRYGRRRPMPRQVRGALRWRRWPAVWSRIPVPLRNRATALVWINLRQSLPLAVCGLMLAALLTLLTLVQVSDYEGGESFASLFPSHTWFVATLWATVVGSGIFAAELQPGLSAFWRSRPITVAAWFWCKFFIGLIATLVVLDGVTIFVSWGTPIGQTSGLSWTYIACMPMIHATLYAMAVFGVCLFRRPVVGAALAIAVFFVTSILVRSLFGASFEPINVHNSLLSDEIDGRLDLMNHGYPLVYGTLAIIAIASTWLASRAIRPSEPRRLFSRRQNLRTTT